MLMKKEAVLIMNARLCHCWCDLRPYRGRLKIVLRLFLKYGILGAAIRGA